LRESLVVIVPPLLRATGYTTVKEEAGHGPVFIFPRYFTRKKRENNSLVTVHAEKAICRKKSKERGCNCWIDSNAHNFFEHTHGQPTGKKKKI
jgi:hypothetical protein